jgi:O-methyltransferase
VSEHKQQAALLREPRAELRHHLLVRALKLIYAPKAAPVCFPRGQKLSLYDMAAEKFGAEPITYLEFGVHKGGTFRQMVRRFPHPDTRLYGFDSFEGLPEAWGANMDRGHFSTGGQLPDITDPRVTFVKGWFQNTVPAFLAANPIHGKVLVNFDADLYSSTLFLLSTLWHFVPEYYFYFDEFIPDEVVAMHDFCDAYPADVEFFACTQDEHSRPLQVFGRLKRKPFELP